jgi:hypothetical protein
MREALLGLVLIACGRVHFDSVCTESCETCPGGCCEQTANAETLNTIACGAGCDCALSCGALFGCDPRCASGSTCSVDCRGADGAQTACEDGASCDVDCRDSESLCTVSCAGTAACLVRCSPDAPGCLLQGCTAMSCADDISVCNRPCP